MLASMVKTGTDAQFTYDHNGLRIKNVVHMAQGDVVALIDANGTQMVEYGYDAWGNPISKTGSLAATIGTLNPFRYRGYVYDEETGLYYLRNRYYKYICFVLKERTADIWM